MNLNFLILITILAGTVYCDLDLFSDVRCERNDQCSVNSYCDLTGKLQCGHGSCSCSPGFIDVSKNPLQTNCVGVATALGYPCEDDKQCTSTLGSATFCKPGASGADKKCSCVQDSVTCEGKCFTKKNFGDGCSADCECDHVPNAHCLRSTSGDPNHCACRHGFELDAGICRAKISLKLGDTCVNDNSCKSIVNAICDASKTCACKIDHIPVDGECLPKRQALGESCSHVSQCSDIEGATCSTGQCTCSTFYVPSEVTRGCILVSQKKL